MGWSEVAARSHARRLEREGWLARYPMKRGDGSLFVATRRGVRMTDLPVTAAVAASLVLTAFQQPTTAFARTRPRPGRPPRPDRRSGSSPRRSLAASHREDECDRAHGGGTREIGAIARAALGGVVVAGAGACAWAQVRLSAGGRFEPAVLTASSMFGYRVGALSCAGLRGYARPMGTRVRILSGVVVALALTPTAAIATRPSVSPVYVVTGYKGFESEGNGSKPELVAAFALGGDREVDPSRGATYAYQILGLRLFTDCSPSLIKVPGSIGRFSVTRRKVSQRVHFNYQRHGVNIRGYFFGPLSEPRVHATAKITRPGCRDVLSFTAAVPKPKRR
jgi:hypothetical protein